MIFETYYKILIDILHTTINEWLNDKVFRMAAALSFYSLISLAPLLMILTVSAGYFFGKQAVAGQIVTRIDEYVGVQSAELIQNLIVNAYAPDSGIVSAIIGFIVFIWAALAVFVEIRESLNTIWGIEVKPGRSLREFFTGRLFSLLILMLVGIFFLLSIIAGKVITMADSFIPDIFGEKIILLQWMEVLLSFISTTGLFIVIIKYLPSVKIEWRYAFTGAIIVSVLFNIGNVVIGIYLGKTNYLSVYGAAGSLVILLLWIYYSSLIFYFGAELTQVVRKKCTDRRLILDENVLKITKVADQVNRYKE